MNQQKKTIRFAMVSLGCPKNLVDAECIVSDLQEASFVSVQDLSKAQVIIVNTCGFIEEAKQEAIDHILNAATYKTKGCCDFLIVTGCLAQRYTKEIQEELPEVDAIVGTKSYGDLYDLIQELYREKEEAQAFLYGFNKHREERILEVKKATQKVLVRRSENKADAIKHLGRKRKPSTEHYAYLKIAEGCSHACAYCAIPGIRGPHQSRPMEDIIEEAKWLISLGYKELILVSQDLSFYGFDLYRKRRLPELLKALLDLEGLKWLRTLYLYPEALTDEFLDLMANNEKFLPYIDLPIQHASNNILKAMKRKETEELLEEKLKILRERIPNVSLRTTVMVGFPGETAEDFATLLNFIKRQKFDHLGCFVYSVEEGTLAANYKNQVPKSLANSRQDLVMQVQQEISRQKLSEKIGTRTDALITGVSDDGLFYTARTWDQAPDVDGESFVLSETEELRLGTFVSGLKIVEVDDYNMTLVKDFQS